MRIKYVALWLLSWIGICLDELLYKLESGIYRKTAFVQFDFSQKIIHWTIICIIWAAWAALLLALFKKSGFNIRKISEKPPLRNLALSGIFLAILTAAMVPLWDGWFKPVAELNMQLRTYGSVGIVSFLFQYIYYAFETLLIFLTIIFGQQLGEHIRWLEKFPLGGFLLGLTWGLLHIFSKDITTGIYCFFAAILYGTTYLILKKNFKYSYWAIYLMFLF